jgi:hypothetical protein
VTRNPGIRPKALTKAQRPTPESPLRETPEMFGERLREDIAQRPEFYFARREVVRLEADLEEFRDELWQIQKAIRESQTRNRHYRNANSCKGIYGMCEYIGLCADGRQVTPGEAVEGFEWVADVHPELTPETKQQGEGKE